MRVPVGVHDGPDRGAGELSISATSDFAVEGRVKVSEDQDAVRDTTMTTEFPFGTYPSGPVVKT